MKQLLILMSMVIGSSLAQARVADFNVLIDEVAEGQAQTEVLVKEQISESGSSGEFTPAAEELPVPAAPSAVVATQP
ncbi:MAG: hypothetical protein KF802_03070 [Bdellovibrionaceae bacterium]|nr:hypothetical protein [Pseudobdellovibrionaceae bacterium]MBX3033398.1 hypothetical protein [Pseudobdellovibrionaceae bacterium]